MIGMTHNVTDASNDCHALTGNEAGQATLPNNTVQPLLTPAALCIIPATYCLCIATEVLPNYANAYTLDTQLWVVNAIVHTIMEIWVVNAIVHTIMEIYYVHYTLNQI